MGRRVFPGWLALSQLLGALIVEVPRAGAACRDCAIAAGSARACAPGVVFSRTRRSRHAVRRKRC